MSSAREVPSMVPASAFASSFRAAVSADFVTAGDFATSARTDTTYSAEVPSCFSQRGPEPVSRRPAVPPGTPSVGPSSRRLPPSSASHQPPPQHEHSSQQPQQRTTVPATARSDNARLSARVAAPAGVPGGSSIYEEALRNTIFAEQRELEKQRHIEAVRRMHEELEELDRSQEEMLQENLRFQDEAEQELAELRQQRADAAEVRSDMQQQLRAWQEQAAAAEAHTVLLETQTRHWENARNAELAAQIHDAEMAAATAAAQEREKYEAALAALHSELQGGAMQQGDEWQEALAVLSCEPDGVKGSLLQELQAQKEGQRQADSELSIWRARLDRLRAEKLVTSREHDADHCKEIMEVQLESARSDVALPGVFRELRVQQEELVLAKVALGTATRELHQLRQEVSPVEDAISHISHYVAASKGAAKEQVQLMVETTAHEVDRLHERMVSDLENSVGEINDQLVAIAELRERQQPKKSQPSRVCAIS
ncbi:hypothetical protein CYMTET_14551 [Cymbomonas tetramitiformis]|uniref:Uncharacterized protein n=1 Tax=Cymbomonas tetramitiformis TaxID=36881 RepID=A0AAE0GHB0_9CHLO|nr:hypothetical protein CYMTET_14551 [Cymbomonas tetramitiformis]